MGCRTTSPLTSHHITSYHITSRTPSRTWRRQERGGAIAEPRESGGAEGVCECVLPPPAATQYETTPPPPSRPQPPLPPPPPPRATDTSRHSSRGARAARRCGRILRRVQGALPHFRSLRDAGSDSSGARERTSGSLRPPIKDLVGRALALARVSRTDQPSEPPPPPRRHYRRPRRRRRSAHRRSSTRAAGRTTGPPARSRPALVSRAKREWTRRPLRFFVVFFAVARALILKHAPASPPHPRYIPPRRGAARGTLFTLATPRRGAARGTLLAREARRALRLW